MATKTLVEDAIAKHDVTIFAKSWCPYCKKTIATVEGLGLPEGTVEILMLDQREDGADIQSYLLEKTSQRTVPNVFVKQQHIGGNDDFQAYNSGGKLQKALGI